MQRNLIIEGNKVASSPGSFSTKVQEEGGIKKLVWKTH